MDSIKKISVFALIFSLVISFTGAKTVFSATVPALGVAESFSVLAGLSMSAAGPGTTISRDLGLSPGLEVSRTGPWTIGGTEYFGPSSLAFTAQADALAAFNNLAGQASDGVWGASTWSPVPGVWTAASDTTFSGTIVLNGDYDDVWVFQVDGDMTFSGTIVLEGTAQPCNVFWQIGRDATIASGSAFVGTIIASRDVTLVSGATVNGRVISLNSSLTTDGNTISGPTCASAPRTSSISGRKWNDVNNDRQSTSEFGIAGWLISIFASESLVGTTTTDSFGNYTFINLDPELNYWVCEEARSGWSQTSPVSASDGTVTCTNGTVGYSAQSDGGPDDFINKNFGNHQNILDETGSITIDKIVVGVDANADEDFTFDHSWNDGSFDLSANDAPHVISNLAAGSYTITELINGTDDWSVSDVTCTTENYSHNAGEGDVQITLGANEDVTCTYTNTYSTDSTDSGSVTIRKAVVGDAVSTWLFNFTSTLGNFTLDQSTVSHTNSNLGAGTYTISEGSLPSDWSFTGIDCGDSVVQKDGSTVAITLPTASSTVDCTFTNTYTKPTTNDRDDDGGSSGGSRRRTSSVRPSSSNEGEVLGEVLAQQTYVLPVGAPATGFGGLKMCLY